MHSWIPSYSLTLWKWWLAMLTGRRSFMPMLGIIYLSLPNATAQEIGLYTAAGQIIAMIFQLPVGMLADKIGVQRILLMGKISLVFSSFCYAFGTSFWWFLIGALFMAFGASVCTEGNILVWLKQYLTSKHRSSDYKYLASSSRGEVSLLSALVILVLPLFSFWDIRIPLYIALCIDIIGLFVVFRLPVVFSSSARSVSSYSFASLLPLIKDHKGTGFFLILLFMGTIEAVLVADSAFRAPYLVSIGYAVPFIGFVMSISRLVWFLVGKSVPLIEQYLSFRQMILIDAILFPLLYLSVSFFSNPYIVGALFSLSIGYMWGRSEIYTDALFERMKSPENAATLLSFKSQYSNMLQILLLLILGSIMAFSYTIGFLFLSIFLLSVLSALAFFILPTLKK